MIGDVREWTEPGGAVWMQSEGNPPARHGRDYQFDQVIGALANYGRRRTVPIDPAVARRKRRAELDAGAPMTRHEKAVAKRKKAKRGGPR